MSSEPPVMYSLSEEESEMHSTEDVFTSGMVRRVLIGYTIMSQGDYWKRKIACSSGIDRNRCYCRVFPLVSESEWKLQSDWMHKYHIQCEERIQCINFHLKQVYVCNYPVKVNKQDRNYRARF